MHLVMFDIDGTLIESCKFDGDCFAEAVKTVTGYELDTDWGSYTNITDPGILDEFLARTGLVEKREQLHSLVKSEFVRLVNAHLEHTPAKEISGAIEFIQHLQGRDDIELAVATGGWGETALAKLLSAGFDITGIAFASSTDAMERTTVMKLAEARCNAQKFRSKTYFGDGAWDKKACEELKYNFVLVGDKLTHENQIEHFSDVELVISCIGI